MIALPRVIKGGWIKKNASRKREELLIWADHSCYMPLALSAIY